MIVRSLASTPDQTTISNTANVSTITSDINLANNTSRIITLVATQADLSVVKTTTAGSVPAGGTIAYTITVANAGPSDAQTVLLSDLVPVNTTFVSATQTSGLAFGLSTPAVGGTGTISGTVSTLASGASATFTVTVLSLSRTPNGSTITNTADVSTVTSDINRANNTSTATTRAFTQADVSVIKTGPVGPILAGNTIAYTITVANTGPSDAQTVSLTDVVPTNTTFVSDTQTSGPTFILNSPAAGGTGTISGTIATLASGASATFTVVVKVSPITPDGSTIANTADVSSVTRDINLANNTSRVTTPDKTSPTVVLLQRYGFHHQPTILVLTFSTPLDPTTAQDKSNYQIVALGSRGEAGAFRGYTSQVTEAVYNSATMTVTLHLARRLNIHNLYQITVIGTAPGGITGPSGTQLDGSGSGPGSNYVGTISRQTLVGAATSRIQGLRALAASASHSIHASVTSRATHGSVVSHPSHSIKANAFDQLSTSGQLRFGAELAGLSVQRRHVRH